MQPAESADTQGAAMHATAGVGGYLGVGQAPEKQDGGFRHLLIHFGGVLVPAHLVVL